METVEIERYEVLVDWLSEMLLQLFTKDQSLVMISSPVIRYKIAVAVVLDLGKTKIREREQQLGVKLTDYFDIVVKDLYMVRVCKLSDRKSVVRHIFYLLYSRKQ